DYGVGSALTYIIMILAGILGLIYIRNVYREVSYL
ncbi:MAG: sugar ABC transporter permease, partial [Clostridiales bacterium]